MRKTASTLGRSAFLVGTITFCLSVSAAPAALAAPEGGDEAVQPDAIIVTGRKSDPKEVSKEAWLFERKIQAEDVGGQLARWNIPICPAVIAVDQKYASYIVDRIRKIAFDVGAPVAKAECRPNIVISFTPDAKELIATLEHRDGRALSSASIRERNIIRTSALPVRWWYTTLLEGSEGEQLESQSALLATQNIPTSSNERFLSSYTSSVIRTKVRSSLVETAVVVDVPASSGVRLDSLSDYITFVALSKIRITEAFSGAPSILSLFEADSAGKDRLTAWDNAYLKGLYSVSNSRLASVQRQLIVQRMVNDVK